MVAAPAPAPCVRAGVTLLPLPWARVSASTGVTVETPPRAIAASDTAPAATNASRSPREEGRAAASPSAAAAAEW